MSYKNLEERRRNARERYHARKQFYKAMLIPMVLPVELKGNKNYKKRNRVKVRLRTATLRQEKQQVLRNYKSGKGCIRCGESHPACLDFHHREPKEKNFTISASLERFSLPKLMLEVVKCDVLCKNCHSKLHWKPKLA